MNLKRHQDIVPEINLTPLIDVVFLLLIFFMVSTTFKKETQMDIILPQASVKPKLTKSNDVNKIEIIISADGKTYLDKKVLDKKSKKVKTDRYEVINPELISRLKRAIKQVSQKNNTVPIVIRADAKSPHQSFIRVMDALGQLGFKRVSIATAPPKDKK